MADASTSLLVINDIIMTSLLLLKIIYVLANFLDFIRDPTIFQQHDVIMTSDTSFCQSSYEVGNDEYITVCNFGSRRMRGFKVIEGDLRALPSPVARGKKKPGLNRVNACPPTLLI